MDLTKRTQDTLRIFENNDRSDTNTVVNNDGVQMQDEEIENMNNMAQPSIGLQGDSTPTEIN